MLVTVSGCSGGTPVSPVAAQGAADPALHAAVADAPMVIELRYDKIASYQNLEFRWVKLEDSRCQTGVQCVWAGQLVATIEVARSKDAPVEIELVHRIGSEPKVTNVHGYELRLQEVIPNPKYGVTYSRNEYIMYLQLSKP